MAHVQSLLFTYCNSPSFLLPKCLQKIHSLYSLGMNDGTMGRTTDVLPLGLRTDKLPLKTMPSSGWQHWQFVPCCNSFLGNQYTQPLEEIQRRKSKPYHFHSFEHFWSAWNTENIWVTGYVFYYFMSCWLILLSSL